MKYSNNSSDLTVDQVMKSASEFKAHLGEYIDEARDKPIFVSKYDRPNVVVISYKRFLALEALEESKRKLGGGGE